MRPGEQLKENRMIFAQLDLDQDPALVLMLWDYANDTPPSHMVEPEYVDVSDVSPTPQPGFTYDGETWEPGVPQQRADNRDSIENELRKEHAANEAFLALEAPTSDELAAQVRALTMQSQGFIRTSLQEYDETVPPPPRVPGERALDSVSPSEGPAAGGTEITLRGSGFTNIGGVRFEGVGQTGWAWSFTVVDDETITCPTPPMPVGTVDVIAFDGDPGDAVLENGFTYT
jgi:hypothetical protein